MYHARHSIRKLTERGRWPSRSYMLPCFLGTPFSLPVYHRILSTHEGHSFPPNNCHTIASAWLRLRLKIMSLTMACENVRQKRTQKSKTQAKAPFHSIDQGTGFIQNTVSPSGQSAVHCCRRRRRRGCRHDRCQSLGNIFPPLTVEWWFARSGGFCAFFCAIQYAQRAAGVRLRCGKTPLLHQRIVKRSPYICANP